MILDEEPIFVRGLSRSGGTLVVTVLDAHPDIAMSYELYPTLLETAYTTNEKIELLIKIFTKAKNVKDAIKKINDDKLIRFINRCDRGGLDVNDLKLIFQEQLSEDKSLQTHQDRLELIAKCCRKKMYREGKSRWGLKCNSSYDVYLSVWPKAHFLNVIRDGRDVLASQLKTGSFKVTAGSLGKSWASTHRSFKKIMENPDVNAYEIMYESLVTAPQDELIKVMSSLGMAFEESMLDYHTKDLTIYSASSHLSMERISVGIDTTKIGRWRAELTEQQAREFYDATNGLMQEYNYQ